MYIFLTKKSPGTFLNALDENYLNSIGSIVNRSLVKCFSVKAIFLNNGGIYCFVQIAVAKYSSLKLDFGKWHFYEIKDSFERDFA